MFFCPWRSRVATKDVTAEQLQDQTVQVFSRELVLRVRSTLPVYSWRKVIKYLDHNLGITLCLLSNKTTARLLKCFWETWRGIYNLQNINRQSKKLILQKLKVPKDSGLAANDWMFSLKSQRTKPAKRKETDSRTSIDHLNSKQLSKSWKMPKKTNASYLLWIEQSPLSNCGLYLILFRNYYSLYQKSRVH